MDIIMQFWPVVLGGFILPMATWIKKKLPTDFPVQSVFIALVLSFLIAWGASKLLFPAATWNEIITLALGTQVFSQITHASNKTIKG